MSDPHAIRLQNQRAWDQRAESRDTFARSLLPSALGSASLVAEQLRLLDARNWYASSVKGQSVLCLGAGGGRHGPILAAAGAKVTVVDLSPGMLHLDEQLAHALGLTLTTLRASIDELAALPGHAFDLVVQPVSTCYVPDIVRVYTEVSRVLRPNGLYVSQHKTPTNLQASTQWANSGYLVQVPYVGGAVLPPASPSRFRESGTLEFLHRWEDLVGGLCRSGFLLEDLVEVPRQSEGEPGSFEHRCNYIAPYVRLKARRRNDLLVSL
jgi:SAM-dependent methyltransferase